MLELIHGDTGYIVKQFDKHYRQIINTDDIKVEGDYPKDENFTLSVRFNGKGVQLIKLAVREVKYINLENVCTNFVSEYPKRQIVKAIPKLVGNEDESRFIVFIFYRERPLNASGNVKIKMFKENKGNISDLKSTHNMEFSRIQSPFKFHEHYTFPIYSGINEQIILVQTYSQ